MTESSLAGAASLIVGDEKPAVTSAGVRAQPYMNPYLAGVGIGLVLLLAFVIMGRGLGASGALSSIVATGVQAAAPEHAAQNLPYAAYLGDGTQSPLKDWLVFEIIGVTLGGLLSATLARRFRRSIDRGPRTTDRTRLMYAFLGGTIMGVGAKFARGCTSGQALTGGALLSVGSWLFIFAAYAAAYAAAPLFRRQWT
jgi:uncharacterized membrane protein YedE/YeeE